MPLPAWLRCPACESGSVTLETIEGPEIVLECNVCRTREAVGIPQEFSPSRRRPTSYPEPSE